MKFFLGNTPQEAEQLHKDFVNLLNDIARSYSISTGIDKADLFGESLFALAEAKEKFDEARNLPFKKWAIFKIKDHLNNYVRENITTVSIPRYLSRAVNIIRKIEELANANGFDGSIEDMIILNKFDELDLDDKTTKKLNTLLKNLDNAATRANITIEKLVKRTMFLPSVLYEAEDPQQDETNNELINEVLLVKTLIKHMNESELSIAKGIMEGKSYVQIGKELQKSPTWVKTTLNKLGKKLTKILKK